MFERLTRQYHLHPIVDHFTIALLVFSLAAEFAAAAPSLLPHLAADRLYAWQEKLRSTALVLMIAGAGAAVFSYFTGDMEANRLWDTISPAAQQLLLPTDGAGQHLSHAVLGEYLMFGFLLLAAWRMLIELSARLARWRVAYLAAGAAAMCLLLYQGKTGGELVYRHGVGVTNPSASAQTAAASMPAVRSRGEQIRLRSASLAGASAPHSTAR